MKVSVIIPTYNRADLVVETIQSVLNQSFDDREIIVIDDGSTDNTLEKLKQFGDKILLIEQENRGVNAARNAGLAIAQGDYIALLDSDDIWIDYKLELDVSILDKYESAAFVYTDFLISKPSGHDIKNGIRTWYTRGHSWDTLFPQSASLPESATQRTDDTKFSNARLYIGDIYHTSLFHPTVLPSASLYRRSVADGNVVLNENDSTCGDWEFFARLSRAGGAIFLDMETTINRSHEDEVRLTRIDRFIQLRRRIRLIDRVWRNDSEYMRNYSTVVNAEQYSLYCKLIQSQIIEGRAADARADIEDFISSDTIATDSKLAVLRFAARIPGLPVLLRSLRWIKRLLSKRGRV